MEFKNHVLSQWVDGQRRHFFFATDTGGFAAGYTMEAQSGTLPLADTTSHAVNAESEWDRAGFFNKWSYSVVNDMLSTGEKHPLQQGIHIITASVLYYIASVWFFS